MRLPGQQQVTPLWVAHIVHEVDVSIFPSPDCKAVVAEVRASTFPFQGQMPLAVVVGVPKVMDCLLRLWAPVAHTAEAEEVLRSQGGMTHANINGRCPAEHFHRGEKAIHRTLPSFACPGAP